MLIANLLTRNDLQGSMDTIEQFAQKALSHEPVTIPISIPNVDSEKPKNFILLSEEDWLSMQETIYINSVPELAKSIKDSMNAPEEEFLTEKEVEW